MARTFVPDTAENNESNDAGTRGWNREVMGRRLAEVREVYLQAVSDNVLNDELMNELRTRFAESNAVRLTSFDKADAALKISVTKSSVANSHVVLVVRAVNAKGYVVWPAGRRRGSWRYVGTPSRIATRVVRDLTADINQAKH